MSAGKSPYGQTLWLLLAGAVTVLMWQLPRGDLIVLPFSVLSIWFHEMGHGLCAMLLGGHFQKLILHPDSGLAYHTTDLYFGPLGDALVAAAGPMGPAFAGGALISFSDGPRRSGFVLGAMALVMAASAAIWIRTVFGFCFIMGTAAILVMAALYGGPGFRRFLVQLLGVQACISAWRQFDYLFTKSVIIDGRERLSDTGVIAQRLLLPHWFWGGLITAAIAVEIYLCLRASIPPPPEPALRSKK